jgi:hypothetical protein
LGAIAHTITKAYVPFEIDVDSSIAVGEATEVSKGTIGNCIFHFSMGSKQTEILLVRRARRQASMLFKLNSTKVVSEAFVTWNSEKSAGNLARKSLAGPFRD